jgi:tetratricopeptide (TPR) repeat protein
LGLTAKIIEQTIDTFSIETIIFVILIFVFLLYISLTTNKTAKRFSVGFFSLISSLLIFMTFYLNKTLASKGNYKTFKLRKADWIDDKYYLDIEFNMQYNSTEVIQEKCLSVDSVDVRVDNGFFGMKVYTDEVLLREKINCETYQPAGNSDSVNYDFEAGQFYATKRCFAMAIDEYSKAIKNDSLNAQNYYHRGLIFLARNDYRSALSDFLTAAYVRYIQLDSQKIENIKNIKLDTYIQNLIQKINNKDTADLRVYLDNIALINDFDTYQKRILFCANKIKKMTDDK